MLFTFLIIISMCFILVKLLPNKPAKQFGKDMQLIEMRREALGYNKPLLEQYVIFLRRSLIGQDWGVSEVLYLGQDVWGKFIEKMPATVIVNAYTMLISVPLGLLLGIYAALKKNKWQDQLISTLVVIFVSTPSYVYAFLVQYFLCFKLKWFPFQMNAGYDYFSWSTFVSIVPAVMSLGFMVPFSSISSPDSNSTRVGRRRMVRVPRVDTTTSFSSPASFSYIVSSGSSVCAYTEVALAMHAASNIVLNVMCYFCNNVKYSHANNGIHVFLFNTVHRWQVTASVSFSLKTLYI